MSQIGFNDTSTVTITAGATSIAKAEDVASADADVGVPAMAILKATPADTAGTDGDYEMLQMSGGRLWVDASGKTLTTSGDVAAASTDSGNPVKIGAVGHTANPTAVTDGQRVNLTADKLGKLVTVGSVRDLKSNQKTTITTSVSETTIVTADATNFLDVYGLILANTSASACNVTIKDATSGTTRFIFAVPAGETRGFICPESAAHKQATANNNWTATCSASITSMEITAVFVKNL